MRPIVSYDDISLPYEASQEGTHPPPAKKRKKNARKKPRHGSVGEMNRRPPEGGSSRTLSHDEIWDDSALIEAWDAAAEEYKMYHGSNNDDWKKDPVHNSPLWYNIPATTANVAAHRSLHPLDHEDCDAQTGIDSQPHNFDSFVPTYNPSLDALSASACNQQIMEPPGVQDENGVDEAFSKAQLAMYWAGYWTAIYQCRRGAAIVGIPQSDSGEGGENDEAGEVGAEEDDDEDEDAEVLGSEELVPSQR